MNESEINKLIKDMVKKFQNGGFIDCLRNGGSVEKCKCGCDKIAKAEDGKKVRRTDMPGYAYTLSDGTDVLTQDAVGIQSLPGSNYSIAGSSPEYETQRTTLTDKGGKPIAYNYNVYLNDDDHFFPIRRYTTQRLWYRPSTWLRTLLTPEAAAEKQAAYDANKLQNGGSFIVNKKNAIKNAMQNGASRRQAVSEFRTRVNSHRNLGFKNRESKFLTASDMIFDPASYPIPTKREMFSANPNMTRKEIKNFYNTELLNAKNAGVNPWSVEAEARRVATNKLKAMK